MMASNFLRIHVRVPISYYVGPIDVPIPDGVDSAKWEEDDILEAAREIWEDAAAGALPDHKCMVDAYPREHPKCGEWVPIYAEPECGGIAEIQSCEEVELDIDTEGGP